MTPAMTDPGPDSQDVHATPAWPCIALLGRLGTPQLACLRSWRRAGVPCVFLHADAAPLPRVVAWLLGVRCVHLGPLRLDDPGFVQRLAAVLAEVGAQALTCVSEPISVALWACRDQLPAGLRIASVRPEQARLLESKVSQDRLARESGLDTLPSHHFVPGQRVQLPPHAFPLVLRPDVARRVEPEFKVAVVHDLAACQVLVDGLAPTSSGVIAQPFVRGPNLLVHAWRSACGRQHGLLAFRAEAKHKGVTVVICPVELDPQIADGCRRMGQALGLTGVYHFDFIVDERSGRTCFLDLNPRLGGTTGKVLSAGYDEPLALVSTLLPEGLPVPRFMATSLRAAGGLHQALSALVGSLQGTSTDADYPHPRRRRLGQLLARHLLTGRDELLRLEALRSLLGFALYQLARRRD